MAPPSCDCAVHLGKQSQQALCQTPSPRPRSLCPRCRWLRCLQEKARLAKMEGDRQAVAQQIQARRAEEFAALKVRGVVWR